MAAHRAQADGGGGGAGERPQDGTGTKSYKWVRWTKAMRETFLSHLAGTCNVRAAAAAAGVTPVSVYWLRRRDAAFADAWGDALTLGYQMLETQLIGHALAGDDSDTMTSGVEPIGVSLALKLLTLHRTATGQLRRGGSKPMFAKPEETDKAILAKLDQIEKRRAKLAAEDAAARMPSDGGAIGAAS